MKSLLTAVALFATLLSSPPAENIETAELEMLLQTEEVFKTRVKIFDYKGNLVKEFKTQDVANEDITVTDYFLLESSDYLFSYLGDFYYLRD